MSETKKQTTYSIKKTREICERATEGPWNQDGETVYTEADNIPDDVSYVAVSPASWWTENENEDLEFIAHARTALPQANELLEKAKTLLEAALDYHMNETDNAPRDWGSSVNDFLAQLSEEEG